MSLELFREDLEKQDSGSPCYINQMAFYVARIGTKESQKAISDIKERLYGVFPKPSEIDESEVYAHWLCEFGIKGWDNVSDKEDGELIDYSVSMARKIFLNREYWLSLNQVLVSHAVNFENYLNDAVMEDAEEIKKP